MDDSALSVRIIINSLDSNERSSYAARGTEAGWSEAIVSSIVRNLIFSWFREATIEAVCDVMKVALWSLLFAKA